MKKVRIMLGILIVLTASTVIIKYQQTPKEQSNTSKLIPVTSPEQLDAKYNNYDEYLDSASQGAFVSNYLNESEEDKKTIQIRLFQSQMLQMTLEGTNKKKINIFDFEEVNLSKTVSITDYSFELSSNDEGNLNPIINVDTSKDDYSYLFSWYMLNDTQSLELDKTSFYLYSKKSKEKYKPDLELSSFLKAGSEENISKQQGLIAYKVPKKDNNDQLMEVVSYNDQKVEGNYYDNKSYQ